MSEEFDPNDALKKADETTSTFDSIKNAMKPSNIWAVMQIVSKETMVAKIIWVMIIGLFLTCLIFMIIERNKQSSECKKMDTLYADKISNIQNVVPVDLKTCNDQCYTLRDYYIKTAYNCCSGGSYKNDYVDTCILKDILKQGVRCLDFEIYSIDDNPVIATSTEDSYFIKETYNSVPFEDFMNIIASNAFTASTVPNPTDPLILHMRIKSSNQNMFTKMAAILKMYDYLTLSPKYSYEYTQCNGDTDAQKCYANNLGTVPLNELQGKIVIIVDKSNSAIMDNEAFYEYVNLTSNSVFMRCLSYFDVKYTPDMNELIEYNKQSMTIVLPDVGSNPDNPSGLVTREMGCQMMAMRYNLVEQNLEENNAFFEKAGSAFVVKPDRLRYSAVTINLTEENDPLLSYAPRTVTTDYYNFTM